MQKDVIIRTVTLGIALLNNLFAMFGLPQLEIENEVIYQGVSTIITIIVSIWTWWKNNSFTKEAQEADQYMKQLKETKTK